MAEIIRIPNIENYTQEIINGDLILTPKLQSIPVINKVLHDQTMVQTVPSKTIPKLGSRLMRIYDKL